MIVTLPDYQLKNQLFESPNSLVYRGWRQEDKHPVILKVMKKEYPTPAEIARFKLEYEIAQNLNLAGVVKPYTLEKYKNSLVIVMEDFGGEDLSKLMIPKKFTLAELLALFIQVTDILDQIHQRHIMHKDINPSNIVAVPPKGILDFGFTISDWKEQSTPVREAVQNLKSKIEGGWQVKIIDFGISTVLSRENATIRNLNVLEGTLAYISPEQTGRMNRAMDYRTDFYSLGVTFYELLTGQLPFHAADAMELVHAHIAKQPRPPHELNPEIPEAISAIVLKLLAKIPEARYQSAYGLKADLVACLTQLQTTGEIEPFIPGQNDLFDKFQISQKLYGRDQEVATLMAAFERVSTPAEGLQGRAELILVSGYAGIGKSSLIQEIHKPITRQRGYFISGKFDQYKRDIPYASLIQAFQALIRQLLTESEDRIAVWKEKLLAAFGPNGQVIIEVIPEIELIVGPQPPVPALPPTEAQNRFNLIFQNFVHVFTQKEHPLVIFLDDLQWADTATLNLLQLLLADPDTQYLLLIGAYRDNEVGPGHPLWLALAEIKKIQMVMTHISLEPLELKHVTQLIADTLHCSAEKAKPLAELVLSKTGGNPFFVNEFLKSLYEEKALRFVSPTSILDFARVPAAGLPILDLEEAAAQSKIQNPKSKIQDGGWVWDVAQIQSMGITDNVVELVAGKIQKLAQSSQEALKLAACIGNQFDLKTLAIVAEKSQTEMAGDLWPALQEGLILPIGDAYKFVQEDGTASFAEGKSAATELVFYEFLHDQVQQAAYSLIPEVAKKEVHLKIGRLMLKNTPSEMLTENVFDIVNQLDFGAALITEPVEREQLAQLNLMAGKKAKSSTAYEPALRYLAAGMDMLAADKWRSQYDLTFALYRERAEAEYLAHNFEQAAALFELLLENAKTPLEKANVYNMRAVQYANLGQFDQVLKVGLTALNLLEVNLPDTEEATQLAVGAELAAIQANLGDRQIADLRHLLVMSDPVKQTTIRLFNTMLATAYLVDNMSLTFLLAAKMVNMSITHGNADVSASGYTWYGLFVGAGLGNLKEAYEFGQLALSLEESPARHQVTYMFANLDHLRHHGRIGIGFYQRAYQMCIEAGDLVYAGYASNCIPIAMFMAGWQLDEVDETIQHYKNTVKITKNPYAHLWPIYEQTVRNLKGLTPDRTSLSEGDFDEGECLASLTKLANERTDLISLNWLGMLKTMQLYIFEDYEAALKYATITNNTIAASTGLYWTSCYKFYYALLLTALYPTATAEDQQTYWERLEQYQAGLQNWVENSPANFEHQHLLVAAEMARLAGQTLEAMDLYDQAIKSARDNEYPHNESIANELAAKFYLARGKEKIAWIYLLEARYAYLKWGANGKVAALDEKYPQLLAQAGTSSARITLTIPPSSNTTTSSALDLISVLKASQAISGEIVLKTLLAKLMKIVIENAGAQLGYLILEKEGHWLIEAEGRVTEVEAKAEAEVIALESVPVERSEKLPLAVINYVARTRENVVLDEATREGIFTQDSYVIQNQPKSILCAPLINQGKLSGMLYLENNLTSGAFTPDRLEVLNLLSAQAAISIENARLYTHQVELTNSASRFVPQEFLQFLRKESIVKVNLGDQVQQNMTILVSDIRSFTTLSESMTPQENFDFVNAYLGRVSPIIRQYHGLIAKYMGDGMMAVFPKRVEDALNAAIAQFAELAHYNAERRQQEQAPIQIGIGIHTGTVMLGTVGEDQRMQLDLFSDAVNVAARLEGLSKLYGVPLIISTEVLQRLVEPDQYQVRFLGKTSVKGRQETLSVFEVFDGDPEEIIALKAETKADFEKALSFYYNWQFAEAKAHFEWVLQRYPEDKASEFYLKRMADFTEQRLPVEDVSVTAAE